MPPNDPFRGYPDQLIQQGRRLTLIAPDDANDLPTIYKALLIGGTAGNIKIDDAEGNTLGAVVPVTAGQTFDAVRVRRVWSTGTSATPIYGIS